MQGQLHQRDAGERTVVRLGGWLFRHRTIIPVPFFLALLILSAGEAAPSPTLTITGAALVAGGEALRLWGVHHIGAISRTRTDRLGPLITSGPFAYGRNPLYVGNIALWVGFAISAQLLWLAPIIAMVLALEYHAIVQWEEQLLAARLGEEYRAYQRAVPRWVPSMRRRRPDPAIRTSSIGERHLRWRDTLFSERGTLLAIAAGYLLLWLKARF
jgi:protein-S-isoprenylcysteine O-methyltransferase Ste14